MFVATDMRSPYIYELKFFAADAEADITSGKMVMVALLEFRKENHRDKLHCEASSCREFTISLLH